MKKLLFVCILLVAAMQFSFTSRPNAVADCTSAHEGTFIYSDNSGDEVVVAIKGDNYTEYHKDKKYTVESKIKWSGDCQADITLVKSTMPGYPHKAGVVINVKIDKVEGDFIYYTAKVKGESFKGSLKKQNTGETNHR